MNSSEPNLQALTQERDQLHSSLTQRLRDIDELKARLSEFESKLSTITIENERLTQILTEKSKETSTQSKQADKAEQKSTETTSLPTNNATVQASSPKTRIGVLIGSARHNGNWRGIHAWVVSRLAQHFRTSPTSIDSTHDIVNIYPEGPMHPLGPVTEPVITALIKSGNYTDERTQQWSQLVSSCEGFVIITPQFNWGYPGDLKNALDHLYSEWRDKPVLLVTYGGHGGGKCSQQLRQVFQGLHMKPVTEEVAIKLPEDYIRGTTRMAQGDFDMKSLVHEQHKFLCEYEEAIDKAAQQFVGLLQKE